MGTSFGNARTRDASECMPLTFAKEGAEVEVCSVHGTHATRQHLVSLGFVEGAMLEVVSTFGGNVIVRIKGSSFGIGQDLARKIYIR